MNRAFWFVAGAGAGVYAMTKARRVVEAFTPEGLQDRLAGLAVGAHLFTDEVRLGMAEKETELRERLDVGLDGSRRTEPVARPAGIAARPTVRPTSREVDS
jgi:hypothetical protein